MQIKHILRIISKHCNMYFILGQGSSLQFCSSLLFPEQWVPPYCGSGSLHVLFRDCEPLPQDILQAVHSFQFDQIPSTGKIKKKQTVVEEDGLKPGFIAI